MTELLIELCNIQIEMVHSTNSARGITKKQMAKELKILKAINELTPIDIEQFKAGTE